MKILNLILEPNVNYQQKLSKKQNNYSNEQNYNKIQHPQEVSGRSLVNFTGIFGKFKLSNDDRKFIDSVSRNLRLSEEDKKLLEDTTEAYLKENRLKSLDDISGSYFEEKQGRYAKLVSNTLKLSEWDFGIFSSDLINRVTFQYDTDEYFPIERKYIKDLEVFNAILDKYEVGEPIKLGIFSTLEEDAENNEYESVFEVFRGKDLSNSATMEYIEEFIDSEKIIDLIIDFSVASAENADNTKILAQQVSFEDKLYDSHTDTTISKTISEQFDINEDCTDDIILELSKRHNGEKSVPQIAFELSDKYNLPSGSEGFIEEVIVISDKIRDFLKNNKQL